MTFPTVLQSAGVAGGAGTPVTGAIAGLNTTNQPWYILGAGTQYRTRQDHAKIKLAYDITPTLRASYTLGWWQNSARAAPRPICAGRTASRSTAATSISTARPTSWPTPPSA
jgi:iron complex outermembrane receptor protein